MKTILLAGTMLAAVIGSASAADQWTPEEIASGLKQQEFVRYALSGAPVRLQIPYALDTECSLVEGYQSVIAEAPEHGTAEIVSYAFNPSYPKGDPRYKCNERTIEGKAVIYTSKDGYAGPDKFTFLAIQPGGFAIETTFFFNVRSFKPQAVDATTLPGGGRPRPKS